MSTLKLDLYSGNKKRYYKKNLDRFKTNFSLISKEYYTALGLSLGMFVGVMFGSFIKGAIGISSGVSMGMIFGLCIGYFLDDKAQKEGRVLQ